MTDRDQPEIEKKPGEAISGSAGSLASAVDEKPEKRLETLIAGVVPEPKREEFKHQITEIFMGLWQGAGPKLDPDVVRIVSETVYKDNENKFQYLSQRQMDATEIAKRDQDLGELGRKDRVRLLWPILMSALIFVLGLTTVGIWFLATGKETIGACLITTIVSGLLGYLGGLGTSRFFKAK